MNETAVKHPFYSRVITSDALRTRSLWTVLTYGLVLLFGVLILTTFLDYGITYDEDWHSTYGNTLFSGTPAASATPAR